MGSIYPGISDEWADWIRRQRVFFVATAPLAAHGHINCSPKGGDSLRILDPRTVAYLDLTGSGAETIAHVRENGRMVIMFCAFEGEPRILRLYGRGHVVLPADLDYESLAAKFPSLPGRRAIVRLSISRMADSCGMGVPSMAHQADRNDLDDWARNKGAEQLAEYRRRKNEKSIDGLPALDLA